MRVKFVLVKDSSTADEVDREQVYDGLATGRLDIAKMENFIRPGTGMRFMN